MDQWKNHLKSFFNKHKSTIDKWAVFVLVIWFLGQIINIAIKPHQLQWDFLVYWTGAKAFFEFGSNPYLLQNLRQIENSLTLPYTYPPLPLFFFRIFTYLPFIYSYELWLFVCTSAVGVILWIWHRHFFKWQLTTMHVVIILASFHILPILGLRTGNVNFLEHALIWLALASLLKNKIIPFALILTAASQFKLTPILFAFAPLFLHKENAAWITVTTACSILAVFSLNFAISSDLTQDFFYFISRWQEGGSTNPCMRSLLWSVSNKIFTTPVPKLLGIPWVEWVYTLFVMFISAAAFHIFRQTRAAPVKYPSSNEKEKFMIYFFILSYALVLPRFKDYNHFLIVLPILQYFDLAIRHRVPKPYAILIFFFAFFPLIPHIYIDSLPFALGTLSHYSSLFATFSLWLGYRALLTKHYVSSPI